MLLSSNDEEHTSADEIGTPPVSVKVIDAEEQFMFPDAAALCKALGCPPDLKLKTLAVVGNTGDGKSHTLNHAFCGGQEVFKTSSSQTTCTLGVWAAFEPERVYLLLDTEGLLGACTNPNRQRRLLLKVFAVADVVVYRTMSDRLHNDMFTFLADASDAFADHFRPQLEAIAQKNDLPWSSRQLGPAVIVFQETTHTDPLEDELASQLACSANNRCTTFLNERFAAIHRNADAFSTLRYVGVSTRGTTTNFSPFVALVDDLMQDTVVRSPRLLAHVHRAFVSLNDHFDAELPDASSLVTFVQEYFTCPSRCTACGVRCRLAVNHSGNDGAPHEAKRPDGKGDGCRYSEALQNKVYYCKHCYKQGQMRLLVPKSMEESENAVSGVMKYIWSGYILKCPEHGVLYRSRALWSGNRPPEDNPNIDWQVVHLWPGEHSLLQGAHPFGQLVVDGLATVSTQVSQLAAPPTRLLSDFIADSVAPSYWVPNSQIKNCICCGYEFPSSSSTASLPEQDNNSSSTSAASTNSCDVARSPSVQVAPSDDAAKHHCRACGEGVCESCSKHRMPVPHHGYTEEAVRVCDRCFESHTRMTHKSTLGQDPNVPHRHSLPSQTNTSSRRVFEILSATASYISPVFNAPKELVKSAVRPDYWQPNEECTCCPLCQGAFGARLPIHHCRSCGLGVCAACSNHRAPVPRRGLDWPNRVCDACFHGNRPVSTAAAPSSSPSSPPSSSSHNKAIA